MTKEDILHHFQDINFYYNDCMMYADLSGMLDELISESEKEMMDKWETLMKEIYDICVALVAIVDTEGCTYGFDTEVEKAEKYIKAYEEDHPDGKKA